MLDDDTRKAMLLDYLRQGILYHRAAEDGLEVPDEPPPVPPEIRLDYIAAMAGTLAATVEYNLHGADADMLNPTPEARQIAAGLCDKAFDGQMPTLDDLHYTEGDH